MTRSCAPPGLAAWLLDPGGDAPSEDVLRAANLAAYGYVALPAPHRARAALRPDFLAARTRHQRIKSELLPLLREWNAAGIGPLLFKGFQLAEFVYPVPGMRHHGDVDVLVHPEQVPAAIELAERSGWAMVAYGGRPTAPWAHGACALLAPGGATCIDLHRWVLGSGLPWNPGQREITRGVWARSRGRSWEGVQIREPDPLDALLVGVVLQRCWSGDRWQLKPHDILDLKAVAELHGVTRDALEARARELAVERTLALFLDRCDPWRGRLDLRRPARRQVRRWNAASVAERGLLWTYGATLARLGRAPRALRWAIRSLPSVLAAHGALRRYRDIEALLRSLEPTRPRARGSLLRRDARAAGIVRIARLLPLNRDGDCLPRALALCHMLWREGWPARFVSGVRREGSGLRGHAWVELDGRVLPALGEPAVRTQYHVNVEYPPAGESGSEGGIRAV